MTTPANPKRHQENPAMHTTDLIAELDAALTARGWRVETRTGNAFGLELVTFYNPDGRLMINASRHPSRPDQASLSGARDWVAWYADLAAGTCSRAALAAVEAALTDGPSVGDALEAAGWRAEETKQRGHVTRRAWHSPDRLREVSVNLELPRSQLWKVRHPGNRDHWYPTGDHLTPPSVIAALALTD